MYLLEAQVSSLTFNKPTHQLLADKTVEGKTSIPGGETAIRSSPDLNKITVTNPSIIMKRKNSKQEKTLKQYEQI